MEWYNWLAFGFVVVAVVVVVIEMLAGTRLVDWDGPQDAIAWKSGFGDANRLDNSGGFCPAAKPPRGEVGLFIGGPWHGCKMRMSPLLNQIRIPSTDPHAIYRMPSLKPCLELKEIEALTGKTFHRQPGELTDLERRGLLEHSYSLREFVGDDLRQWVYVDDSIDDETMHRLVCELFHIRSR